ERTGWHKASTRASAAALAATSGPMPEGSPVVIAMRGFTRRVQCRAKASPPGSAMAAAGSATARPAAAGAATGRVVAAALAAASAVLHAFRVRQLVAEAAFQPPAQARELGGIEAQVLLLGHLDRDRLEALKERRAAERPATGAVAAVHLRFVAHADLAHLDAGAELGGQLAHQLAEVDAAVGSEIKNQLRSVECLLDARQLHAQAALADFQQRDPVRFLLAVLLLHPRDDVVARRNAHDPRRLIAAGHPFRLELRDIADDGAERRAVLVLDDDRVAAPRHRLRVGKQVGGGAADRRQLHRHDRYPRRRAHSCSTTQSATIFTPALRGGASATSASSTAANARTPRSRRYAVVRRSSASRASRL